MSSPKDKIKYLEEWEVNALWKSIYAEPGTLHYERNVAIFELGKYCALRAGEVGMLRLNEVNLEKRQLYVRREKNSNSIMLRVVDNSVWDALLEYIAVRRNYYTESDYLFPSQKGVPISRKQLDTMFKFYCSRTAIPEEKRHFHVLRHTRAIELGEQGATIYEIQWWLGHKNIANTQIYAQFTTRLQSGLYAKLSGNESEPCADPVQMILQDKRVNAILDFIMQQIRTVDAKAKHARVNALNGSNFDFLELDGEECQNDEKIKK